MSSEQSNKLNIIPPSDPLLKTVAEEISLNEILSDEVQRIIDQMLEIAGGERGDVDRRTLVGLSAPQVGVAKRIILVDVGIDASRKNLGQLKAYINPQILWKSEEEEVGREGCFSTANLFGFVSRAKQIRISAYDREGKHVEEELTNFTARIFQHECDHLNGIRFPDRMGPEAIFYRVEPEEVLEFREVLQDWKKTCSYADWIQIRDNL
jgi:peptide deformylase